MSDAIHGWLAAIGAHPLLVLAVVFVVACAESIALIGTIVPAGAVMFAAGTLIGAGALDAWTTLGVAAVGAIVGDGVSYELGRRYRGAIRNGWVRFGYANAYARGEQFVLRHGMKSIVLARFLAPVRAVVPVVVGCATLPRRAFYPVNIVSALIWALVHVAPGILFGASAALAAAISVRVAAILLVVAALVALVWIGVRLTLRRGWPLLRRIAAAGMHACARRWPRFGTRLHAAIEALRRLPGAVPVLALLFVGCVWLFGDVVRDVVANDPLTHADIALYSFLQNLRTPPVDAAMRALAVLHGRDTGLIVAAAFLVWLMIHRCWLTSAWWAATVGVAVVLAPAFGAGALGTTPASLPPGTLHVPLPDADAAFAIVASSGIGWLLARDRPAVARAGRHGRRAVDRTGRLRAALCGRHLAVGADRRLEPRARLVRGAGRHLCVLAGARARAAARRAGRAGGRHGDGRRVDRARAVGARSRGASACGRRRRDDGRPVAARRLAARAGATHRDRRRSRGVSAAAMVRDVGYARSPSVAGRLATRDAVVARERTALAPAAGAGRRVAGAAALHARREHAARVRARRSARPDSRLVLRLWRYPYVLQDALGTRPPGTARCIARRCIGPRG
jgi:membrane protein DedA with SNARE-associated domain